MILYTLWTRGEIFSLLESLLLAIKKLNGIFDTESNIIHFMGSNKYMITNIKCWPVFKQDPQFGQKIHFGAFT